MRLFISLVFLFALLSLDAQNPNYLNFISYNLRYDNPQDGPNAWPERKNALVKQLEQYRPNVLGIQEGEAHQLAYLDSMLAKHHFTGIGRNEGKPGGGDKGEFSAIFYNFEKFTLLKSGTFWLSDAPEKYSVGWDAALPRICTYALFESKETSFRFWVFNTHFDHKGVEAREKSAEVLLSEIEKTNTNNYPVILMGDFNAEPDSKPIQTIKKQFSDSYGDHPSLAFGPIGTFNGFDPDQHLDRRIDYIFTQGFKVQTVWHIDDRRPDNYFISDHLPVLLVAGY
ncbi:MAG: endonuclease/exonuclease/phosphatase family protein [Saprospiraceae bacterium]